MFALVGIGLTALGLYVGWLVGSHGFFGAANKASAWLKTLTRDDAHGYLLAFGPFALVLAVSVLLLVRHGLPEFWRAAKQSLLVSLLVSGCLLAIGFLNSSTLTIFSGLPWLFFAPVVPPVLLAYQALAAWRQRPRSFGSFAIGVSAAAQEALERECLWRRYRATYDDLYRVFGGVYRQEPSNGEQAALTAAPAAPRSQATGSTAYDPTYFITNFALPALLLLVIGFGVVSLALESSSAAPPGSPPLPNSLSLPISVGLANCFLHGLRWGVAGAFVYVLIDFGTRLFRNDLTVGAATWAIVTLMVGPTLAVVLAIAWNMTSAADGTQEWQAGAVLFFAGLAPRRVVTILESAALQLLKAQTPAVTAGKVTPLTNLRGITAEVAARLREENIDDVSTLAYADPIRLVQSLPYDLRQVIDWIDQAVLATVLPKHYDTLIERGVTGSIDLAWRWLNVSIGQVENEWRIQPRTPEDIPPTFVALANGNQGDALLIYEAAAQLLYEAQVCLLWVMYNCFSTTAGTVEPAMGETAGGRSRAR